MDKIDDEYDRSRHLPWRQFDAPNARKIVIVHNQAGAPPCVGHLIAVLLAFITPVIKSVTYICTAL